MPIDESCFIVMSNSGRCIHKGKLAELVTIMFKGSNAVVTIPLILPDKYEIPTPCHLPEAVYIYGTLTLVHKYNV